MAPQYPISVWKHNRSISGICYIWEKMVLVSFPKERQWEVNKKFQNVGRWTQTLVFLIEIVCGVDCRAKVSAWWWLVRENKQAYHTYWHSSKGCITLNILGCFNRDIIFTSVRSISVTISRLFGLCSLSAIFFSNKKTDASYKHSTHTVHQTVIYIIMKNHAWSWIHVIIYLLSLIMNI